MDKEKKTESLRFLLAAGSKIYGEKKLIEMLVEQGAPNKKNLDELLNDKKLRFIHITMALKESEDFIWQLENRLSELCNIAESLEIGNPDIIRKWLSDDCKPCLVEHIIEGYEDVYKIMIELDNRLMWPGWPLIGKLHDPIE
uniref:Uncharacterized protein n=1 Tax=uncultured marine group II/III euryarchaeote KM3_147_B09 TaxID=1457882 RepID=A0A075GHI5_9EURY|nr:hypothetical protein [uncultured marine group II/III euryarchaeote KM3_147_B09]